MKSAGLLGFGRIDLAFRHGASIKRACIGSRGFVERDGGAWRAIPHATGMVHLVVDEPGLGPVDRVASVGSLIGPWVPRGGGVGERMDRRRKRALRLLEALRRPDLEPGDNWDATSASEVPGWCVQRSFAGHGRAWEYVSPDMRDATIPHALPPAVRVTRAELLETLRELWLPDASRWIHGS